MSEEGLMIIPLEKADGARAEGGEEETSSS